MDYVNVGDMLIAKVVADRISDILSSENVKHNRTGCDVINIPINKHNNCYMHFNINNAILKTYVCDNLFVAKTVILYSDPNLFDSVLKYIRARITENNRT